MEYKEGEVKIIGEIYNLFSVIENLYNELSEETKHKIYEYHAENYSLTHCIRWGLQAAEELNIED